MATATISIEVDAESARVFAQAPADERRKLQLLLGLRLKELTSQSGRPLKLIMDQIGAEAKARGLTPDKLESLSDGE